MSIGAVLFSLHDLGTDPVANYRIFNKEGIAINFAYALSVVSDIYDVHRQNIVLFVQKIFFSHL